MYKQIAVKAIQNCSEIALAWKMHAEMTWASGMCVKGSSKHCYDPNDVPENLLKKKKKHNKEDNCNS